jgi:glycosyltransferase involved in cell wall biosynthesis
MQVSKHILFLVSRLDEPGGTERANLNAAHLLLEHGHKITIVILDITANSFYPIDSKIQVIQYPYLFGIEKSGNVFTRKLSFIKNIIGLRKVLKRLKPDFIIATDYPHSVGCILAGYQTQSKVYSWEHHHFHWLQKNWFWKKMIDFTYPRLAGILCYNVDETKYYKKWTAKTYVIPNFIFDVPEIEIAPQKIILTVGWLIERKGVDLIPAMAKTVFEKFPEWKWIIIGEGPLGETLVDQIKKFNLDGRLVVQSPQKPLLPNDYQLASIYVMTSRMEPFGLVLIEAMSNGVPCIAFDCETGPRHIIENNTTGILVEPENANAMTNAIIDLITNDEKRISMAENSRESVKRFSAENVYKQWEKIFNAE